MRNLFCGMMALTLSAGSVFGEEMPGFNFQSVRIEGSIVQDGVDHVYFATSIIAGNSYHSFGMVRLNPDKTESTILMKLDEAQSIADEAIPYIRLAKRAKNLDDILGDGDVKLEISFDGEFKITLRDTGRGDEITYLGDRAFLVMEAMSSAEDIGPRWAYPLVAKTFSAQDGKTGRQPPASGGKSAARESVAAFPIADLAVKSMFGGAYGIKGRITNNGGKDLEMGMFSISFFDGAGKLLGSGNAFISDFKDGATVTFDGLTRDDISGWASYEVRLETGM
jgi:hypothetical protein